MEEVWQIKNVKTKIDHDSKTVGGFNRRPWKCRANTSVNSGGTQMRMKKRITILAAVTAVCMLGSGCSAIGGKNRFRMWRW